MAFIPVPDVAYVSLESTLVGQLCINTFYYLITAPPITLVALEDLCTEFMTAVVGDLLAVSPDTRVFTRVVATDLTTDPGLQALTLAPPGTDGTQTSTMPGSVCMSIKRTTGFTGRSHRGRIYMPLWDAAISDTDPNISSPTIAANIIAGIQAIDDAVASLGWTPVVVSRQENGVPLLVGEAYPITGWSVADFNVDSQRRRLAGRGA